MSVEVVRIDAASWERLRALRLESLRESPQAFGGTFESEAQRSELEWRHAMTSDLVGFSADPNL